MTLVTLFLALACLSVLDLPQITVHFCLLELPLSFTDVPNQLFEVLLA